MTDRMIQFLMEQARMHGLGFILLAAAVYYFQTENAKMTDEIRACNNTIIEMYRTDRLQLQEIIANNTKALEEIKLITR